MPFFNWCNIKSDILVINISDHFIFFSAPYVQGEGNWAKKGFWAAHAGFLGCFLAPLVATYGDVVAQAALYTAGITGGISAIGWCAPSQGSNILKNMIRRKSLFINMISITRAFGTY
jgi:hypothetical protein